MRGWSSIGISRTVMDTVSEPVALPSLAVNVKVKVVLELTCGAVNVVKRDVELLMMMPVAWSWLHR